MIDLNFEQLLKVQMNRPPYLMIDRAFNIIPGKCSEASKYLKDDEWFFKCHFPGDPNMPGMLQLEALSQTAALAIIMLPGNLKKIIYIIKANEILFKKKVVAGDTLKIKTKLLSWKRGLGNAECKGYVNDELVCSAIFSLVLNSELENFKVR